MKRTWYIFFQRIEIAYQHKYKRLRAGYVIEKNYNHWRTVFQLQTKKNIKQYCLVFYYKLLAQRFSSSLSLQYAVKFTNTKKRTYSSIFIVWKIIKFTSYIKYINQAKSLTGGFESTWKLRKKIKLNLRFCQNQLGRCFDPLMRRQCYVCNFFRGGVNILT